MIFTSGFTRAICLKVLIFTVLISVNFISNKVFAYNEPESYFRTYEDSIKINLFLLATERDDANKELINKKILTYFRNILENANSFNFSFDSLKNKMGIVTSSDYRLRIICWNIPYDDGTHKYFGFIQYQKSKNKYFVYELNDRSDAIDKPELAILGHENWYGALYYHIITNKYRGKVYYTLLGADLNNLFTKKKIVEILYINKQNFPVFGDKVFKNNKVSVSRVILEYSAQANMTLNFNNEREMIIYDHLSPSRPSLAGRFEFYGPDFTYDALKFENGIWNAYFDIDIRNNNIE